MVYVARACGFGETKKNKNNKKKKEKNEPHFVKTPTDAEALAGKPRGKAVILLTQLSYRKLLQNAII